MKIRTKLLFSAATSIGLVIVLGLVIFFSDRQVDEALAKNQTASRIREHVSELNVLTAAYQENGGERTLTQWYSVRDDLADLLAPAEFASMMENLETLEATFAQLVGSRSAQTANGFEPSATHAPVEDRLVAQLSLWSQSITSEAVQLADATRADIAGVEERATVLTLVFVGALLAIVIGTGVAVSLSIGNPIKRLTRAAEDIAKGNLNTRAEGIGGKDEIGILGGAFNLMAARLKETIDPLEQRVAERTAANEELRLEITERKRAEEALRESEHELAERGKELNCLYGISVLVDKPGISLQEILQGTADLIPASWQYPQVTCARIIVDGQEFRTANFKQTTWRQASNIMVSGQRAGSVEVYYLDKRPESDEGPFLKEESALINAVGERLGHISEHKRAEEELNKIEWLLKPKVFQAETFAPFYGDVTKCNTDRTILDALGAETIKNIINEFMGLMGTSSAVYEKNGDYAGGIFSSGWCRFLDDASFKLCNTVDLKQALNCGKWRCHESCWTEASKKAIETGLPTDIECAGGIHLYAIPIRLGNEIIGSINVGHGDPPKDPDKLAEIAGKYQVDIKELAKLANEYQTRPPYIIELAKHRLAGTAELIGLLVERKRAEQALRESERQVRRKLDAILSPEANISALELSDIIDSEKIQKLMDELYKVTHMGIGIIDLHGRVLVGTGWQEICTKFHRINPETCRSCMESDLELSRDVPVGTFKRYRCKNNMWDIATPIKVGDLHLGNIFLGQFLFDDETVDYETFRQQALRYGFDEQEYIAALDRSSRWSRKTVDAMMSFYASFAEMIGNLSYANVKPAGALEDRKRAEQQLKKLNKTLEQRVTERTAAAEERAQELARSNGELDDFTYVVSHDLKEPLRGIEAFSTFLAEDYADKLDEQGQKYVGVLRDSAMRMNALIEDLLVLSRIGRVQQEYATVSVESLLEDIRQDLAFTLEQKKVDLRIQSGLPTITYQPVHLRQVFQNLISNAIKFNDKPQPVVEIACHEDDGTYIFSVRDNGIGIDEKYYEKIFQIFQRLGRREDYEGTGAGLTICKKIVEARGGKIWLESKVGEGSIFSFTIPKSIRPDQGRKEKGNEELSGPG
jgi:signal transduction histidine kinase